MKWLLARFCDFLLLLLLSILFKVLGVGLPLDNSVGLSYRDLTRQQRDRGQHS